jgi:putative cardiolipin synthase
MNPRRWLAWIILCCLLAGCAGTLPPHVDRAVSEARPAPAGTPIADIAGRIGLPEGATAAWPMPQAPFALDARLAAIERATTSLDTQTYLLADDPTGREVLRALRDAAARGVRVRLLLDDSGTTGLDELLLGLASEPNAEVRLFNPFVGGREWKFGRLLALASDFDRLDHRMHNKLFIADGALAIVGGRNLADDYFLRSASATISTLSCVSSARSSPSSAARSIATGTARLLTTCGRSRRRRGRRGPTLPRCVRVRAPYGCRCAGGAPTEADLFGAPA